MKILQIKKKIIKKLLIEMGANNENIDKIIKEAEKKKKILIKY